MTDQTIGQFSVHYLSILDSDGNVDPGMMPALSDDDIRTMYWYMNLSRIFNTKMLNFQKQGRLGTLASVRGQEGAEVASIYALKDQPNVWIVPSFRETASMITYGFPMDQILRYWGGYEEGNRNPSLKILPINIPIGSQVGHAHGIAHAMNIKGEKGVVIVYFGDGATSEGETLEALNFAGVFKTPAIFFCQNNQYAISVPRKRQTAAGTLAQKAIADGFDGVQVDGNDVFAVYKAVRAAAEKALTGKGPTFIEAVTYRIDNHTTADDWHKYRSEQEVQEWEKKDPITRLKKYMVIKGIWNEEHEQGMLADANRRVEEAVKKYEATPTAQVEDIFDYLYAKLPPLIQEQKEQWTRFWRQHG